MRVADVDDDRQPVSHPDKDHPKPERQRLVKAGQGQAGGFGDQSFKVHEQSLWLLSRCVQRPAAVQDHVFRTFPGRLPVPIRQRSAIQGFGLLADVRTVRCGGSKSIQKRLIDLHYRTRVNPSLCQRRPSVGPVVRIGFYLILHNCRAVHRNPAMTRCGKDLFGSAADRRLSCCRISGRLSRCVVAAMSGLDKRVDRQVRSYSLLFDHMVRI